MSDLDAFELRATCGVGNHGEACPGERVCACPCHWPTHPLHVLTKGAVGVVSRCGCGWAAWGLTVHAAVNMWVTHVRTTS